MAEYATPDPEWVPIAATLPPQFDRNIEPAVLQEEWITVTQPFLAQVNKPLLPDDSKYRVEDHQVPVEGGEIPVRVVIPNSGDAAATYPLIVWMHGGGWALGDIHQDDFLLRILSFELQATIVNVGYRPAPQYPFPTGLNDSYAAVKWAASNADKLSASVSKGFIVGGQSAGGNFSAVIAHRAHADPFFQDKPLTGQHLSVPATLRYEAYPEKYKSELRSWEDNKDAHVLNAESMRYFFKHYQAPADDPEMSPALYPSHAGLPPAHFQVCGLDPLRDEGLLYERLLREADTPTRLDVYPGVPHAFQIAAPQIALASKFRNDTFSGFRWLLAGDHCV
ncbi:hypothetical protein BV25DRAFT_1338218 [Artomyces pyxidatus]|uniref:Uncharacterized protein n=1 Tax=Artomyces pyxidatus TaxID=48021 RepID=A0ACB8SNB2_9AGAM|nr:hypothetical protein BV25DRAFT_1338218 [Artomyces pyxidatus]